MGNCKSIKVSDCGTQRKITLAIFGLDNAGKTLTTKGLTGESTDMVAPTIGFSNVTFNFQNNQIVLYDLGGGANIRNIWKNYFAEIYGLVYVIDASDQSRIQESKRELLKIISNQMILEKPLLILANKQDLRDALDETDIYNELDLENLANMYKTPCMLKCCSAFTKSHKQMDASIKQGFDWLVRTIESQWGKLNPRVMTDVEEKRKREEQEKKERLERVRKSRELRGEKENETDDNGDDKGEQDVIDKKYDPFIRVGK